MELMKERVESAALASATVVLLRDGPPGLEVFLLRRHGASDVLGGAYVFPGGKVDAADAAWAGRTDLPATELHALLAEPSLSETDAGALFVAAVRELFEETGLLLATGVTPARAAQAWADLRAGADFGELLAGLAAQPAASALHPWSRWITPTLPSVSRKRFDTRFFVAVVPPGHTPAHDTHEADASEWLTPAEALRRYWAGAIEFAPPQIMSMVHLARHANVASVLDQARRGPPPCIRPQPFDIDGVRTLCYPGDPWHDESRQLLPGPTRLCWRNGHFEPEGGLPALLGD